MAVIYLRHIVHGTKVACSEQEAKYDETKGWKRYSLDSELPAVDEHPADELPQETQAEPAEEDIDVLRSAWEAANGKPADKRWGVNKLRKGLR